MDSSDSLPKNGIELRTWRLEHGFTQLRIAMAVGTSQRTVSAWEATNDTLHRIARERLHRMLHDDGYHLSATPLPRSNRSTRIMVGGKPYTPTGTTCVDMSRIADALPGETLAQYQARTGKLKEYTK